MTPRAHIIPETHAWCVMLGTERVVWQTTIGLRSLFASRDALRRFLRTKELRIDRKNRVVPRTYQPREWRQ